jgi:hypothetical protein
MDPALLERQREYEARKARTKLALNLCTICGKKAKGPCKGCGTTAYCSTDCQRIDWRDRGHREACKKIQDERAAARAEAPTPPPSPPRDVVYGPAPRSHADEVRARIAAEHEAARARREANPDPEPTSARRGARCPICMEDWDVNVSSMLKTCCCRSICQSCAVKLHKQNQPCALCRSPAPKSLAEVQARLRRHVENEVPEAITHFAAAHLNGKYGIKKSSKKAAKLYKRAVELGNVDAMVSLASLYVRGDGVKLDEKKAEQLYRMAADRGDAIAQNNLACALIRNDRDMKETANEISVSQEAFQLDLLSAEQGYTQAEALIGAFYLAGSGVPQNLEVARRWLARAAAKGDEDAKRDLARLDAVTAR